MEGPGDSDSLRLHASCVAWKDRAVLVTGASGSGKSTLALQLLAYGCLLVSDDQTLLYRSDAGLGATAPDTIKGQIEARGIGILSAETAGPCHVVLAVDLDHIEETRLPPQRSVTYLGVEVPLIPGTRYANFSAAVLQLMKAGFRSV